MKLLYAGTPEFAVTPLQYLLDAGFKPICVVTQPDKPQGRKGILTSPPVKVLAEANGIPVVQYPRIRDHVSEIKAFGADVLVTCAYGQILTQELLDCFPAGVYNIHASLLPKYRGASPIQWSVLNGEEETGVTIMQTDAGLDTGDILLQKRIAVNENTAEELAARLSVLGGEAILEALSHLNELPRTPQNGAEATVVKKISKQDAKIDFSKPAFQVANLIRGMNPAPVAYAFLGEQTVNFYRAKAVDCADEALPGTVLTDTPKAGLLVKCGVGAVQISELQFSGGKRMSARDVLNGRKLIKGQILQ